MKAFNNINLLAINEVNLNSHTNTLILSLFIYKPLASYDSNDLQLNNNANNNNSIPFLS